MEFLFDTVNGISKTLTHNFPRIVQTLVQIVEGGLEEWQSLSDYLKIRKSTNLSKNEPLINQ